MDLQKLNETAKALVADGKGILAADESSGTIKKRFDSIGVESTEDNRRDYREFLFRAEGSENHISGVILFDETLRQDAADGTPLREVLSSKGIIPGIKVDTGAKPLALSEGETVTEGLDGLRERLAEYAELGARFAKWRATYSIGGGLPSEYCVWTNAHALARYAALCQEADIVPIVEPEVLQDGTHTLEESSSATGRALNALYTELHDQRVELSGTLLKPNMVLSRLRGVVAGRRRGGRAGDDGVLLPPRPGRGAGDRVPLRRPDRRGRDRPPERDERARAASVAAVVLVRPRAPGARAEGVGRQGGERRGGAGCVSAPRAAERRCALRELHGGHGVGCRGLVLAPGEAD